MTNARAQAFLELRPELPELRRQVYEAVLAAGDPGATLRDVVISTGRPMHSVSGRVTELVNAGWLRDTGQRRDGQTIWALGNGRTEGRRKQQKQHAIGSVLKSRWRDSGAAELVIMFENGLDLKLIEPGMRVTMEWRP